MSKPTELELMEYYDGELGEPRRAEVADWLDGNLDGAAKLRGLSLLSGLVEQVSLKQVAADFDLADDVLRAIEAEAPHATNGAAAPSATGGKVIALPKREPKAGEREDAISADGTGDQRGGALILGMAVLAAAAAAALFIWGRGGPATELPVASHADSSQFEPVLPLSAANLPTLAVTADAVALGDDPQPTVEVAAVDFGARLGAIYYVDGDMAGASTTTVVWVTDE